MLSYVPARVNNATVCKYERKRVCIRRAPLRLGAESRGRDGVALIRARNSRDARRKERFART